MEIIENIKLNEKGININEQNNPMAIRYFDDNGSLPEGNYNKNDIEGDWVVVKGKHEIGKYAYRNIDNCTLIKKES